MDYDDLSREELVARLQAASLERRAHGENSRLLQELQTHQLELQAANAALRERQAELETSRARYADLYDFAPVPHMTLDRGTTILEANPAAAAMLGFERSHVLGKRLLALAKFEQPSVVLSHVERCLETGATTTNDLRFETALGSHDVQIVSKALVSTSGERETVIAAFADVSALRGQHRLEQARAVEADLRARLQQAAAAHIALSEAIARMDDEHVEGPLEVLGDHARTLTGAAYAIVALVTRDGRAFEHFVFSGLAPELVSESVRPRQPRGILGDVLRAREPRRARDVRANPALPSASFLGVPMCRGDRTLGAIYLAKRVGAEEFSDADELSAVLLAERAGVAIEILHLIRRERRRSELLDAASAKLGKTTTTGEAAEAIARLAVPALGESCAVCLRGPGGALAIAAAHGRDARSDLPDEIADAVLEEGRPRFIAERSALLVPLCRDGVAFGLLDIGRSAPRLADEDASLAVELARRAALALESARLHETARRALDSRNEILAVVSHDLAYLLDDVLVGAGGLQATARDAALAAQVDGIVNAARRVKSLLAALRDATRSESAPIPRAASPSGLRPKQSAPADPEKKSAS